MINDLSKKKIIFFSVAILLIATIVLFPQKSLAQDKIADAVSSIFGPIIMALISFLGKLITVVARLLVNIAQYNDFINSPAVSKGWLIIRDILNIFLIIILLVIAFATVLKVERYSYKRLLGSLLIAAVLVNFSKLICGLIIDFAQIITLTFVNAFKSASEGNLAQMMGLETMMKLRNDTSVAGTKFAYELLGSLFLGLIMAIIGLIVVTIITLIFAFRIIILWFLVLLSPMAFLGSVLPLTQSYANKWWENFTNQVIVGPILAFFLWISFAVVQGQGDTVYKTVIPEENANNIAGEMTATNTGTSGLAATISEAGKPQYILNFVIGIGMLLGSLMMAQQVGGAGSKMAGNWLGKIQSYAQGKAQAPFKLAGSAVKGAKYLKSEAVKGIEARTGVPLTKDKWKEIWKERRTKIDRDRKTLFEAGGISGKEGRKSVLPKGAEEWADTLRLKGLKAMGKRFIKGGKADKFRSQAAALEQENANIDELLKTPISETEYKTKEQQLSTAQNNAQTELNQWQIIKKTFTQIGDLNLNNLNDLLSSLRADRANLAKENQNTKEIDDFITNIERAKEKAQNSGKNSVNIQNIIPDDQQRIFSRKKIGEWLAKNENSAQVKVNETEAAYNNFRKQYVFEDTDKNTAEQEIKGLKAVISGLKISDKTKQSLLKQISDLLGEIDKINKNTALKDRQAIVNKIFDLRKNLQSSLKEENVEDDDINKAVAKTRAPVAALSKGQISEQEMKENLDKKKKNENLIRDLRAQAEEIKPLSLTAEQISAMNQSMMNEYERIKSIEDIDELMTMWARAVQQRNEGLAKAVIYKLNSTGDIDRLLRSMDLEEGFRGMADLAEKLKEHFGIPLREAAIFMNDLGAQNKKTRNYRYINPFIKNKTTGEYERVTNDQHKNMVLAASATQDKEKLFRDSPPATIFIKTQDQMGRAIPVLDDTGMAIVERDLEVFHKEYIVSGRLSAGLEQSFTHENSIKQLEEMAKRPDILSEQKKKLQEIIKKLKQRQYLYW